METICIDRPRIGVSLITLNRPTKRNALNVRMVQEIAAALTEAAADDEVRAVVVTGDEQAFSAGADIADQFAKGRDAAFSPVRLKAWDVIQNFPKPSIAAVNGYALGGGAELVMLLDFAIAGDSAVFGQPEINLGILPGDGATQRLARLVGRANALRLILTGERVDAERALRLGLVTEIVPRDQTVSRALDVAETIASKSALAVRYAKDAIVRGFEMPLADGLLLERENLDLVFGSADQLEGMAAFVEKRTAEFRPSGHPRSEPVPSD